MRQGLLSEPQASSGPAAMLLAVSRSPSSIPRTESLPGAMPPSSGVPQPHPPLKTSNNIPDCIHPRTDATFLWRPSPSTPQNLKNTPDCIHSPERCHLPLASLSIPTKKTAPGSSNTARHRNQNTRQTDLYNI